VGQETPEDARDLPSLKGLFGGLAALGEEVENSFEDDQVFAGEGARRSELFVEFLERCSTPDDLFFVVRPVVYRHCC